MTNQVRHTVGLVMFPGMTQLDVMGPYEVFNFMPNTRTLLLWKTLEPVTSAEGIRILPDTTFDQCPQLDVLCVPGGGPKQVEMMQDRQMLAFLQQQGATAKFVTAVCTGSLLLAAAGLLQGYRAATHWAFRDLLTIMGVEVGTQRVVIDRNRITGGGVTAGIDFGLTLASVLHREEVAKLIQLLLEYNPAPPYDTGSPEKAGTGLVEIVKTAFGEANFIAFLEASKQAATRLGIQNQPSVR